MRARHLLDIASLGDNDIAWLLERASTLTTATPPRLDGLIIANLFYEASTRTRVSFELAARGTGAEVVNIAAERASVTKGESLADTARTLHALGVNIIVLRHRENGAPLELASELPENMHLVNGGDGTRAHPTQALLDALTLTQAGVEISRARIAIIGDIRHSRVARSDIELFTRLGAKNIRIAGPGPLLPNDDELNNAVRYESLEDAVTDADVIIMLRIQKERLERAGGPDPARYHADWGLTAAHLKLAGANCQVLHPGPMNRGVEIASEVADAPCSLIWQQVANGLPVRMAVFEWLTR